VLGAAVLAALLVTAASAAAIVAAPSSASGSAGDPWAAGDALGEPCGHGGKGVRTDLWSQLSRASSRVQMTGLRTKEE
jgi:hypothetical protein